LTPSRLSSGAGSAGHTHARRSCVQDHQPARENLARYAPATGELAIFSRLIAVTVVDYCFSMRRPRGSSLLPADQKPAVRLSGYAFKVRDAPFGSSGAAGGASQSTQRKNGGKSMPIWAWVLIILLIVFLLGGFGYRRRR